MSFRYRNDLWGIVIHKRKAGPKPIVFPTEFTQLALKRPLDFARKLAERSRARLHRMSGAVVLGGNGLMKSAKNI